MVRRMYLTIALLLVMSTGLLLLLLGGTVYRELREELSRESQQALQMQADAIHDAIHDTHIKDHPHDEGDIHDQRGQYIYFYANTPEGVIHSTETPIPYPFLTQTLTGHTFLHIKYNERPYMVYAYKTTVDGSRDTVYAYTLTTEDQAVLHHVASLMWVVGGIGFIIALFGNMFLARRLVQPTVQTWTAYRETVLGLSHELQTPLATVKAMMRTRNVEPSTARDVQHELDRASKMVSDMLYLSRLKSGVQERDTQPVAVSDITEEVAERYRVFAAEQGFELRGLAEPGLYVETTQGEWERLVSTLFKNVIDHACPDTPATWHLISSGRHITFAIENTVRRAETESTKAPERGVGLQIVARLVARMHGTLQKRRKGDKFTVTLQVLSRRRRW